MLAICYIIFYAIILVFSNVHSRKRLKKINNFLIKIDIYFQHQLLQIYIRHCGLLKCSWWPFWILMEAILFYFWLYPLDSCSIVILDPKNLWLHIKIITVTIIHSELQPFQILLATILDFVGSHFVYFWLYPLHSCSNIILPQKYMITHQYYNLAIIQSELHPFQISLSAILDFV